MRVPRFPSAARRVTLSPMTAAAPVLYDNPASTNGLKVRLLLAELGLEVTRVAVPLAGERPASYRALHPFGLVPCLVDGDLVVPESNTILRHLAARAGRDDLYPTALAARTRIDALLDSLSLQLRPALWEAERVVVYGEPETGAWRQPLEEVLDGWERMLAEARPVIGPFTIADCAGAGRLLHLGALGLDPARTPAITALVEGARERLSWAVATAWRPA